MSRLGRSRALLIAALLALATLPYLNILFNGFVYDDNTQLVPNPLVTSLRHVKDIFTPHVWSHEAITISNFYRPLMALAYLLCYQVFGMKAYGFHLVSLLLHGVAVSLVFVVTERQTGDRVWAFVAGALFALHPVHTEAVDWIAAISELEVTVFYLLTFGLFLAVGRPLKPQALESRSMPAEGLLPAGRTALPTDGARQLKPQTLNIRPTLLMGGTFLLALLSKEQAMTLPAVATVYEHFFRGDRSETSAMQKLARYGVLWLVGAAYVLFRIRVLGAVAPRELLPWVTPLDTVLSAIALVGQYAGKLMWPVRLCLFYVFHPSESFFDLRVLAGLAVLLALAAFVLVYWRSRDRGLHFACFGVVWFLATLAPVLNAHWAGDNVFTERYLYLPSVGLAWLAGWGTSKLWSRARPGSVRRRALVLTGLVLCGLCAARIVIRNRDWNNDISLYKQTLELSPDAYTITYNLGYAYWLQGDLDNAERAWGKAAAMQPYNTGLLYKLGLVLFQKHQYAEAARFLERVSLLWPSAAQPHLDLGKTYVKLGLRDTAEAHLRAAVELSPLDPRARNELGRLLFEAGQWKEAEKQFRASLRLEPSVIACDFLGLLEVRRRNVEAAERDFQAALRLDGSDSNAHFGLGDIYAQAGRHGEALSHYQAGLAKDPTNPQALAAMQKLRQPNPGPTPQN